MNQKHFNVTIKAYSLFYVMSRWLLLFLLAVKSHQENGKQMKFDNFIHQHFCLTYSNVLSQIKKCPIWMINWI